MPTTASRTLVGVDLGGSGFRVRRLRLLSREPLELETDDEGEETEHVWPAGGAGAGARCAQVAAVIDGALAGRDPALVAIAAPGRKTADGRGIEHALNFPLVPDLAGAIAAALARPGSQVAIPILGDGVAAARGEQVEPRGELRGVEWGYYLGAGTGLSEALVVRGVVRALDELQPPVPRAFELPRGDRRGSFEEQLSMRGFLRTWGELRADAADPSTPEEYAGALEVYAGAIEALVTDRVRRLRAFERVVLGQGCARLFGAAAGLERLRGLGPAFRLSRLRAAPAIGAVAFALDHEARHGRDAWVTS